jgi:hypothetical protein
VSNYKEGVTKFLEIGLKKEEPRAGKRKPIEESDDEEETKKVRQLFTHLYYRMKTN